MTHTAALTPSQTAPLLRAAFDGIRAEVSAAPVEALRWRPGPREWCVLEVIGHLIEAEQRGFAGRIRQILDRPGLGLTAWDQEAVAAARRDHEREPSALLDELAALRAAAADLVSGLGAADLSKHGEHPKVGRLLVSDLLHEWVHHDRNHMRQMLANLQAYVWPHMGNARRFSEPETP
jgi:hypothetical protein